MANLNLSFSFATLYPASGSHPVCHAPANREDGLGSETNVTKTLWLQISRWSKALPNKALQMEQVEIEAWHERQLL